MEDDISIVACLGAANVAFSSQLNPWHCEDRSVKIMEDTFQNLGRQEFTTIYKVTEKYKVPLASHNHWGMSEYSVHHNQGKTHTLERKKIQGIITV